MVRECGKGCAGDRACDRGRCNMLEHVFVYLA